MATYGNFLKHPLQLISSLWDTPHPVAEKLIATQEAAAQGAGINQITAPNGLCGWIPTENGQDWVCKAFGQVMPGVVFWVSVLVVTVTVAFLIRFYMRSQRANDELDKLLKALEAFPRLGPQDWLKSEQGQLILKALSLAEVSLPPVAPLKRKISEALVPVDKSQRSLALNKPLSELSGEGSALKAWTGARLADELPSWLTAIGLLTTFLAILLGLQNVRVLSNLDVQGIGSLVNGLSGKFFSSIVALTCAVVVTISNYFWSDSVGGRWQRLLDRLQSLMPSLSLERAVLDLMHERQKHPDL